MYLLNDFFEGKIVHIVSSIKSIKELDFSKPDNINDLLYKLVKYRFVFTNKYCGGYCANVDKEIAISKQSGFSHSEYLPVIFHELGHAYQDQYEEVYKVTLKDFLLYEWQAEQFAVKTLSAIEKKFNEKLLPINYKYAYSNKEDIDFLKNWHGIK